MDYFGPYFPWTVKEPTGMTCPFQFVLLDCKSVLTFSSNSEVVLHRITLIFRRLKMGKVFKSNTWLLILDPEVMCARRPRCWQSANQRPRHSFSEYMYSAGQYERKDLLSRSQMATSGSSLQSIENKFEFISLCLCCMFHLFLLSLSTHLVFKLAQ